MRNSQGRNILKNVNNVHPTRKHQGEIYYPLKSKITFKAIN